MAKIWKDIRKNVKSGKKCWNLDGSVVILHHPPMDVLLEAHNDPEATANSGPSRPALPSLANPAIWTPKVRFGLWMSLDVFSKCWYLLKQQSKTFITWKRWIIPTLLPRRRQISKIARMIRPADCWTCGQKVGGHGRTQYWPIHGG